MGSVDTTSTYDYVIVGGGTAGLTVADRLSENADVSVLVIEAGQDRSTDPLVMTPGLTGALYGKPEYDWNFNSVPQKYLNGRKINTPRGKLLGGSSSVNFMMMLHPTRGSIDAWATLGNEGWTYDALEPYFRKTSTFHPPPAYARDIVDLSKYDDGLKGDGPLDISFSAGYGPNNAAWFQAWASLGLAATADLRSGNVMGAFQQPASIHPVTKTRSSAVQAHYTPAIAARPNLTVLTETLVKKVLFDEMLAEPVAKGVLVETKDGAEQTIVCNREVILAAGTFMSSQLLELSGIGSRNLLEGFGIPVIVENPSVGENLQDHPFSVQNFEVNPGVASSDVLTRDPALLQAAMAQYQATREGFLGESNFSIVYTPLLDANGVASDKKQLLAAHDEHLQTYDRAVLRALLDEDAGEPFGEFILFPGQGNTAMAEPASMADYLAPGMPQDCIAVLSTLQHPFSRGSVHITSADPHEKPAWDPNFNSHPVDVEVAARQVQLVEKLVRTAPFSDLLKPDGARMPDIQGGDDPAALDAAKEIVRQSTIGMFHPSGSCSMRPRDKGGVVDGRLRVYGTRGLRVVDASVFPLEPVGNIQSVVYAVAERAADLIKDEWN